MCQLDASRYSSESLFVLGLLSFLRDITTRFRFPRWSDGWKHLLFLDNLDSNFGSEVFFFSLDDCLRSYSANKCAGQWTDNNDGDFVSDDVVVQETCCANASWEFLNHAISDKDSIVCFEPFNASIQSMHGHSDGEERASKFSIG